MRLTAQNCTASFSYSISTYFVQFTNTSYGGSKSIGYYWNFGDGTYSSLKNPVHAYSNRGTYRVALYISDGSCTNLKMDTVVIVSQSPGCKALFNYTIHGDTVSFNNTSTGVDSITNFNWDFGDGSSSADQDPVHIYTKGGNKYVWLYAQNSSCNDSFAVALYIAPKKTCNAKFNYVVGHDTLFFQQSTINYQALHYWTFGDNSTSTSINPYHIFNKNGKFQVCLLLTDTTSGCIESWCDSVIVSGIPCATAEFNYSINSNTVLFNDLSTQGMAIFSWLFGDGKESNLQNPTHTYSQAGDYMVRLVVSDSNFTCYDDITKVIHIASKKELYKINGKVFCEKNFIDQALVLLIHTDSLAKKVIRIDSTFIAKKDSGAYSFCKLVKGFYSIKVIVPSQSSNYGLYAPVYLSGDYSWQMNKAIYINFNYEDADFKLKPLNNFVSSGILSGVTKTEEDTAKGYISVPLSFKSITVFNQDNQLIACAISDKLGRFAISLQGEGIYKATMDIPGKSASSLQFDLSRNKLYFNRCIFYEDALKTYPDLTYATGIANQPVNQLSLYPNPAGSSINISSNEAIGYIQIFNMSGQMIRAENKNGSASFEIDLTPLAAGIYQIQVVTESGNISRKLFVKE